jgi:hypothetical protein
MARTALTAIVCGGPWDYDGVALTWTAADAALKNQVTLTGREIVLVDNTNVGAQTVTFTSVADPYGRTKDMSFSIPAANKRIFGPFTRQGWDSGGQLLIDCAAADVMLCVLRLPDSWTGK